MNMVAATCTKHSQLLRSSMASCIALSTMPAGLPGSWCHQGSPCPQCVCCMHANVCTGTLVRACGVCWQGCLLMLLSVPHGRLLPAACLLPLTVITVLKACMAVPAVDTTAAVAIAAAACCLLPVVTACYLLPLPTTDGHLHRHAAKQPKPLQNNHTVFLKALWKPMRAILGWWQITRMVRPLTGTTTLRAISIEMWWLCLEPESQYSRDLLQRRSSIEPGHRRVASSGADTTTVTEEGL